MSLSTLRGTRLKIDTLIFDMDGVITTEEKYWACARLTLWEVVTQTLGLSQAFDDAVHDDTAREAVTADDLIYALKGRAVNSNWDITFVLVCVYLAALPGAKVSQAADAVEFLQTIRGTLSGTADWPRVLQDFLASTHELEGRPLIQEAGNRLKIALGFGPAIEDAPLLQVEGPFWWYLHGRFQRFYHGEALQAFDAPPLIDGTALPAEQIAATLKSLRDTGYTIGTATGRPLDELMDALGSLGLLDYFDANRLGTLDVIRHAEAALSIRGLTKPHPFSLLKALYPEASLETLLDPNFQRMQRDNVIVIGDSTSDVLMAKAGGCHCVGVRTGVRGQAAQAERAKLLLNAGCEAILDDITQLPEWLAEAETAINL
ncbi:MAG: HAD hydrolase-like protein [Chloroflexota bacterium]